MSSSRSRAFSLGLLATVAVAPAAADERAPFETAKNWKVERTVGDTSAHACLMTHTYKDKDDGNALNAISFALDDAGAAIALAYQGWEWDKDEKVKLSVSFDKRTIKMKGPWLGDGITLRTEFPATLVPDLLATRQIVLKFDDGEADFDVSNFAVGYEALIRCNAATAKVVAEAPANPPSPPAAPAPRAANPAPAPAAQAAPAPLAIAKLEFVSRPAGEFGDIAPRNSTVFRVGEKLRSYLEVTGQTLKPTAPGVRTFSLRLDYDILNSDGKVIGGQKALLDKEFTLEVPDQPTVHFNVGLDLTGIEPGAYTLAYTLYDKLDGRTAKGNLSFSEVREVAEPSAPAAEVRAKAFFVGLMAQRTIKECDFATTGKMRAALDAKMATLQPSDPAVDKELRMTAGNGGPSCPNTPDLEAKFEQNIHNLITMSPEDYVILMDKRIAEREAERGNPKP